MHTTPKWNLIKIWIWKIIDIEISSIPNIFTALRIQFITTARHFFFQFMFCKYLFYLYICDLSPVTVVETSAYIHGMSANHKFKIILYLWIIK